MNNQELSKILSSENISIDILSSIDFSNINNPDVVETMDITNDKLGLTPLHVLCMNVNINYEIIKYLIKNSDANFENYTLIKYKNKKTLICPLTFLCENVSFNSEIFELIKNYSFSPNDLMKHKKYCPIMTLFGNNNVTVKMIRIIHDLGNNIYQKSSIDKNVTSFDCLFENKSINSEIVQFIFNNYELNILFTKSAIIKLLNNPNIDFAILSYLNDKYQRIVTDNFVVILSNPKISKLESISL